MLALTRTNTLQRRLAPLILGTCVMAASGAAAEIYQWTDKSGQTVFSESPPPDAVHTVIKPKFGKKSPATLERTKARGGATVPKDAQATADQVAKTPAEPTPAEKKANCAKAREVLTQLGTSNRLRAKNEKGEIVYLPEEARQDRIDAAEKSIQSWCG